MKKVFLGTMFVCATMMLSSCYVQEVNVGMAEYDQAIQVAKVKNHQFIYGLAEKKTDKAENYVQDTKHFRMKTMQTFWDGFLAGITCGIYTPSTTYYYKPAK
ncbi:MAG: hypothetical protein IJK87_09515 [Prevotella sp.]|nr:hypothetical protein [Prevotella sp.]